MLKDLQRHYQVGLVRDRHRHHTQDPDSKSLTNATFGELTSPKAATRLQGCRLFASPQAPGNVASSASLTTNPWTFSFKPPSTTLVRIGRSHDDCQRAVCRSLRLGTSRKRSDKHFPPLQVPVCFLVSFSSLHLSFHSLVSRESRHGRWHHFA
jgi:hypothetical protein